MFLCLALCVFFFDLICFLCMCPLPPVAPQTPPVQQEVGQRAELQALEAERAHPGQLLSSSRTANERPPRQVSEKEEIFFVVVDFRVVKYL